MATPGKTVFWFRRDLRLEDNVGFYHALQHSTEVIPIFIYDKNILDDLPRDDSRVAFIGTSLAKINEQLLASNSCFATFYGDPLDIFQQLLTQNNINAVYANKDYEPYATNRDAAVKDLLASAGIRFELYKDQVLFEQNEVVKTDGTPYVVFTPYSRKWKQELRISGISSFPSESLLQNIGAHSYPFLTPGEFGFIDPIVTFPNFQISDGFAANYETVRNFPHLNQTTKLSVHLRFGTVSIRKIVALAMKESDTFLNELIWREFFMQILWHFPFTVRRSFRPKYDAIRWRNNEAEFGAWCKGETGYPIVDAGMRELNATGFMQNRVRMITASFLCKHLLIDWRWGETYFAMKLLDYEQASNVGNWQWAAGSGVDAAPYFRIFNPSEQVKKFDKDLLYIQKWVPELNELTYPQPIVDHKEARKRCLRVYKEALG
ncbi:MAG TPA: deoxyribodipyrimidine photo-lyase [Flavobacterium sp.]|jgi:deoxyribodipyrimidine photo-lyase